MKLTKEQIIATSEFMDDNWEAFMNIAKNSGIIDIVSEVDMAKDYDYFARVEDIKKYFSNADEWRKLTAPIDEAYSHDLGMEFKYGFFTAILLRDIIL